MKFINKFWPLLFLIVFFGFLFFFRFDWSTLANWDEAWYGSVARNIAKTGNFMYMDFNGRPYYDHPPVAFILMALSIKIFGVNAFAVRFPSALLGLGSIVMMYLLGKELFKERLVGFASALILGTSVWYLIRVRSGDLDATFVFFYLLTVFMSVKSSRNFYLFPLTMASFALLVLSKTFVGLSAGVLIIFTNFSQFFKSKRNLLVAFAGVAVFVALAFPWYYAQLTRFENFYEEHFIKVGLRSKGFSSFFHLETDLPLFYLHMGVRKWYYLWLASLGLILLSLRFVKKEYFLVLLWNLVILYPFLTTNETHIWHLIPVYLPMALIISSGFYWGKELFRRIAKIKKLDWLLNLGYAALFVGLSIIQVKNFYKEVYPTSIYTPYDVDVSKHAAGLDKKIYLDDDFYPIAIYYSGRQMNVLAFQPEGKRKAMDIFKSEEKDFSMITRNYVLNLLSEAGIDYKVDYRNKSYSIISKPTSQP